jgi:ABC-type branched-subunit amino acid transport system substrate-binding protein
VSWAGAVGLLAVSLLAAACSNASSGPSSNAGETAPGVTSTAINVGSLATETGTLAGGFGEIVDGVKAYFAYINAHGGVDGRKLYLKYEADDTGSGTTNASQARNLVEEDHVFAIVGVGTPFFEGASYLKSTGTPTFGYVVSQDWNNASNLFGAYGSYLTFNTGANTDAYVAKVNHAKNAAVVALGIAKQSYQACQSVINGLNAAHVHVAFKDLAFAYNGNPVNDVRQMASDHVDFFFTCMDGADNLAFAKTMGQYGLSGIHSLWLNGYDRKTVADNPKLLNNTIFLIQHVPFEAAQDFPGVYPGMEQYISVMKKYEPKWVYDDISFQGWINAAQFVAGLKAVDAKYGKNGLTQKRLVDAINASKNFSANHVIAPPIDWSTAHTESLPPYCSAFVVAQNGSLHTYLVQGKHGVFLCFNTNGVNPEAPPPGTPGA